MTMSAGKQRRRIQARAFFMSQAKCQALPLACQALEAETLGAGGWGLGVIIYWIGRMLTQSPEPRAQSRQRRHR